MQYIKFIIGALFVISITLNIVLIRGCDKVDYKQSNTALILGDSSREIIYTQSQFEDKLKAELEYAKSHQIKPKQLIKYLQLHLSASDSLRIANTYQNSTNDSNDLLVDGEVSFDTLNYDVRFFDKETDCFIVSGISYPDTTILSTHYNTSIETFFYWRYKYKWIKRVLHLSWERYNDVISISSCSNDTISVQKNISIIKR